MEGLLMESSSKKSGGVEIPKRNRSLDLKSLYKSRAPEVEGSKKQVPDENDQESVKKKGRKRSRKEVSLSCLESDAKKSKKDDADGVKSEPGFSQKLIGWGEGLHGLSLALGENGSAFNFPRRPRGSVGRKRLEIHQVSEPLGRPDSVDRTGSFNGGVIKSQKEVGTSDQLVRSVPISAGNDGASNSKSARKVGGPISKIKRKPYSRSTSKGLLKSVHHAGAFNDEVIKPEKELGTSDQSARSGTFSAGNNDDSKTKSAGKDGGSNSKIKPKADSKSTSKGLPKSVDGMGALRNEVIEPGKELGTSEQLVRSVTISAGDDGASNSKAARKVGGSNSKLKQKADSKSTSKGLSKSVDRAGAFGVEVAEPEKELGAGDQLIRSVTISAGNDGASYSKAVRKVGGSNSKMKQKVDAKSTSKGLAKSVDRGGAFGDEVVEPEKELGASDQLVRSGTISASNDGASNSKAARKVGGSNSKMKQKADSKSTSKGLLKSVDRAGAFGDEVAEPEKELGASDQLVRSGTISAGNDGASNSKAVRRVGGASSKMKQKAFSKSSSKGFPRSVDHAGAFGDEVVESDKELGTSDQLVRPVTFSAVNDGVSNSKSVRKVGGSISKIKQKKGLPRSVDHLGALTDEVIKTEKEFGASDQLVRSDAISSGGNDGAANSKAARKAGGSKSKIQLKANLKSTSKGVPKSVDRAGAISDEVIEPEKELGTSDQLGGSVTISAGKDSASNTKPTRKVGGSKSKIKQKADSKSTNKGISKSVDLTGALNDKVIEPEKERGTSDQLVRSVTISAGNNGALNSKVGAKADGSKGKIKQKADAKSTSKGSGSNVNLKRKAGADELKGSKSGGLSSVPHAEEDSKAVNNGDMSSKKRRTNSRKKKDLEVGRDGGEASKKSEPSVGGSIVDRAIVDFDEDDDDEENLEQNAARMLSSRFDPNCTGFSSKRKSSTSQTTNGLSFPVSSSRDSFNQHADSSGGLDSASADDKSRALRPRREDKGKGVPRKRRHFYEILPSHLDPHFVLNRRIKVFWPLDESWYYGLVNDYHPECKLHHVKYDDRDEEWIDLHEEKFKLLLLPTEVPGRAKSRKVSKGDNDVHKGEKARPEDDDCCIANCLESEPIALWLARSSQRGKSLQNSLRTQRKSHMELPVVSSLSYEKTDNLNSDLADSRRNRSNPDCEPILANKFIVHRVVHKSMLGTINGEHVVYFRKKNGSKKGEGSGSMSRTIKAYGRAPGTVTPLVPVTVSFPARKDDTFFCGLGDSNKQLWSINHQGQLRLNLELVESEEFRFQICVPELPFRGFSLPTGDFLLLHNMFMVQHGVMLATSPAVIMEMLFIDSHLGLRLLMFEGCMKQALACVFLILNVFGRPDEHVNLDMQSPVTSIRFRLSSFHDLRKHHVFEFHCFSRLRRSRWVCLDSKLLEHCLLIKQLSASECTYDNIKDLEYGSLKQCKAHAGLELSSYAGCNEKLLPRILPVSVSKEACNTRISLSALTLGGKPGKTPQFALCFSAAPTLFLTLHLQLLMQNSFSGGTLHPQDAQCSPESLVNGSLPNSECPQFEPSSLAVEDITENIIGIPETEAPAFMGLTSSDGKMATDVDSEGNVVEKADSSQNLYLGNQDGSGSRSSWQGSRSSSIASPLRGLSSRWPCGSPKFMGSGFSNGPKKPRTQVQYTLPGTGYDFSAKQKLQNQRALPCKRIRRASLKRISDGSRSNQKNFELVACGANVLVTHGDKGWREHGALIFLEVADHNEWILAIKLSGVTKYSYKVKHIFQPGSTNRYSHAMLWKGGKDWVLEFPDRSQWMLFKEMHEECYNRNVRAASVKNIPIPGVRLIEESDDYGTEIPFFRNSTKYFRQVQTDVEMAMDPSHTLYDMDTDDEQWLMAYRTGTGENRCEEISEELLEKTMDMFEKLSYAQHRDNFTDAEIQELVNGMGSAEAAKVIFKHWQEKRGKKGMPLIRHLQPPLWERYQQQLKEWEHSVARGNSGISVRTQEKAATPEKPPMFAFCLKPRGLDIPNKGSKQRSHRKFLVSGHHATSGDHDSLLILGRRSNGHAFGDEKVLYTSSIHESSDGSPSLQASTRVLSPRDAPFSLSAVVRESKRRVYKKKTRKLGSYPSSFNQQTASYNQRTIGKTNGVQQLNMGSPDLSSQRQYYFEGTPGQGLEDLDASDLHEFRLRDASGVAQHALNIAKLKREKAQRLLYKADLAIHKAVTALMTAEAIKSAYENTGESDATEAAHENSNGSEATKAACEDSNGGNLMIS
ncbi:uncharacterized protein LOC105169395 [Sesamum indicum]|uniref:Enhancer of polycomb-like protein n=1 Tax=Sesamum indicum TaxID=4182 RepID=A0A6I9U2S0_SESIN|nr:uncharacterized protein LOC105169395 [Sesamum indicum]